jgi:hypothetical protein
MMDPITSIYTGLSLIYIFGFIGAALKYIDQVYDEGMYDIRAAQILSVIVGALMGLIIAFDPMAGALIMAIIIGVGLTNKLDNHAHQTAAILAFLIPLTIILFHGGDFMLQISWLPLILMLLAGVADEKMDEIGDEKEIWWLTTRPTMKIMAFLLVAAQQLHHHYFFAFIAFDIGYLIVTYHSQKIIYQYTSLGSLTRKPDIL